MVREFSATKNLLVSSRDELKGQSELFAQDLAAYEANPEPLVDFGSHKIPKDEAIRRIQGKLQKTQLQIQELSSSISYLPMDIKLAQLALENLSNDRS
jgi:hypothetical protein